jgi:hypothetical protein
MDIRDLLVDWIAPDATKTQGIRRAPLLWNGLRRKRKRAASRLSRFPEK